MDNKKDLNPNQLLGLLGDLLGQIDEKDLKNYLSSLDGVKTDGDFENMESPPSLQAIFKIAKQNKIPLSSVVQLVLKYALESKKK